MEFNSGFKGLIIRLQIKGKGITASKPLLSYTSFSVFSLSRVKTYILFLPHKIQRVGHRKGTCVSPKRIKGWSIPHHLPVPWPRSLRRRSAAARLLRVWVRIPIGAWMSVCCVLSDNGLCDELITRPEESYQLWCVAVCDLENLVNEEVLAH